MTALELNIAVVGAGICGLCTALFLRQLGHTITVYEKQNELSEAGAGIQIPPNAARLLARLGLLSALRAHSFEPLLLQVRRYSDGTILQQMPGSPMAKKLTGYPYMLIHRASYQQILYEATIKADVTVTFGANISTIDIETTSLVFQDGQMLNFDLIIGADGVHSLVRQVLAGERPAAPIVHRHRVYRALVDSDIMSTNSITKTLVDTAMVNCWVGPDRHIVAYPISSTNYNIVMTHPGRTVEIRSWDQPGSLSEMKQTYADFSNQVKTMLDLVEDVRAWKILEVPSQETWTSVNGTVVLCGDAAHAMLPYAAQGAAQAIEDAAVLSACIGHLSSNFGIRLCTKAYERLRKPRIEKVAAASNANGEMWHAEDGPLQQARDHVWIERSGQLPIDKLEHEVDSNYSAGRPQNSPSSADFQSWLYQTDVLAEVNAAIRDGSSNE